MAEEDVDDSEVFIAPEDIQEELEIGGEDAPMDEDEEFDEEEPIDRIEFADDSIQGFFEHKVFAVDIHPIDPLLAVSGGGDDRSYLWKLDTGEKICDLGIHTDSVSSVGFSTDGTLVASGGLDGTLFIFTINGQLLQTLEGPTEITFIDWHPRGNVILAGGEDGTTWMWNAQTGVCMNVFTGPSDAVTCGKFSPDGKLVVTGSQDGSIIVWDPKTAAAIQKWTPADARFHQAPITSLSIKSDSSTILSGAQDGSVLLLNVSGRILETLPKHSETVEAIEFSKNLAYAAIGSVAGTIDVIDSTTNKVRFRVKQDEAVTKICWSPTRPVFVSSSVDGTVTIWDGRTGEIVKTLKGHQNAIMDLRIRPDGDIAVTGADDGTCLVFPLV